jgi:hypothetical protein
LLISAQGHAEPGSEGSFQGLSGHWSGAGTVTMTDGATERIRCKATYAVNATGKAVQQTLRCASDSYRFEISSNVISEGGSLSGSWAEATRGASIAGVVALVTLLGVLNFIGIKPSARTGDVISVIKVLGLVAFVAVGLFHVRAANLHAAPSPAAGESPGLFAAAFAGLFEVVPPVRTEEAEITKLQCSRGGPNEHPQQCPPDADWSRANRQAGSKRTDAAGAASLGVDIVVDIALPACT